jgi:hypothetical protein
MALTDLFEPGVLLAIGVTVGFFAAVALGVAVLRRVVARRNPGLDAVGLEPDSATPRANREPDLA